MDLSDWDDIRENVVSVPINVSTGNTNIVSGVSGHRIVLVQCVIVNDGQNLVKFTDGTGGADLTGAMRLYSKFGGSLQPSTASGVIVMPFSPAGWLHFSENTALNINVSGGGDVAGVLSLIYWKRFRKQDGLYNQFK